MREERSSHAPMMTCVQPRTGCVIQSKHSTTILTWSAWAGRYCRAGPLLLLRGSRVTTGVHWQSPIMGLALFTPLQILQSAGPLQILLFAVRCLTESVDSPALSCVVRTAN